MRSSDSRSDRHIECNIAAGVDSTRIASTRGTSERLKRLSVRVRCALLISLCAAALTACLASPAPPSPPIGAIAPAARKPAPIAVPDRVSLPRDETVHDDLTEWWYYTGHLTAEARQYGFELVVFQAHRGDNPAGYAAHFAITDHDRRGFFYDQRVAVGDLPRPAHGFDLRVRDWRMWGEGPVDHLIAASGAYAIDLTVRAEKPAAIHRGRGVVGLGAGGDSFYYSYTRMAVSGTVGDHGRTAQAAGSAWMDHEWGNFVVGGPVGWQWFGVQLDDGRELMAWLVRGTGGVTTPYGTWVDRNGTASDLVPGDVAVTELGRWTSAGTGVTYPSGWSLRVGSRALDLTIAPVLRDQELDVTASTGEPYWEGEAMAQGSESGSPVTGKAYVELTGYAGRRR